jgi:hypothetical protein
MNCSALTIHHGIFARCTRPPHQPHEFHSASEIVGGVAHFITWRDGSVTFIRAMEEMERTTAKAALAELCAGFKRG